MVDRVVRGYSGTYRRLPLPSHHNINNFSEALRTYAQDISNSRLLPCQISQSFYLFDAILSNFSIFFYQVLHFPWK